MKYQTKLIPQLNSIQKMILSIIRDNTLTNSSLNTLQLLFKQVHENFKILLGYTYCMPTHKSTIYLGDLVSNTFERFYLIINILDRFIMDIEQFKIK